MDHPSLVAAVHGPLELPPEPARRLPRRLLPRLTQRRMIRLMRLVSLPLRLLRTHLLDRLADLLSDRRGGVQPLLGVLLGRVVGGAFALDQGQDLVQLAALLGLLGFQLGQPGVLGFLGLGGLLHRVAVSHASASVVAVPRRSCRACRPAPSGWPAAAGTHPAPPTDPPRAPGYATAHPCHSAWYQFYGRHYRA